MHTEDAAHPVALQHAALAQLPGTAGGLLRGLEQEQHVVGQFLYVFRCPLRQGEHHGHVAVMAAGVHAPGVLRGIGQTRFLRHGQGIHVCPEGHGIAAAGVKPGADAPGGGRKNLAAQGLQDRTNILDGLRQLIIQLRDAVQTAAMINGRHGEDLLAGQKFISILYHSPADKNTQWGNFLDFFRDSCRKLERLQKFFLHSCRDGGMMTQNEIEARMR